MEKIQIIKDTVVPMVIENIDTDQIIPARFLKAVDRKGFGDNLFRDWRFDEDGKLKQEFVLNNELYAGKILLVGNNFGCGSSREHAAWALYDYGFRVIVSTFFADIFKENALNNGILPVEISKEFHEILTEEVERDAQTKISVNLERQEIRLIISGEVEIFQINRYKKECLLNGLDDLEFLIQMRSEIENYELKNGVEERVTAIHEN